MSTTSRGWEMHGVPQPHMEALWGFRGGRMGGGRGMLKRKQTPTTVSAQTYLFRVVWLSSVERSTGPCVREE